MTPAAADEAPHAPTAALNWSDAWQFDGATSDGVGLTVRLECFPNLRRAWFWAYLVLPSLSGPVVVRDHEVPLPRQGLEVRAEGLWSELWCEAPLDHWTCGLEAFAVRLDDPDDARTGEIGERIALGLDIEWEHGGPVHTHPDDWPVAGYVLPGIVHGDVLLGRERFELDARGEYHRTWGDRDAVAAGAWSMHGAGDFGFHVEGAGGRIDGFRSAGDDEIEIEALMRAPVPLDGGGVLDRALCRFSAAGGVAYGWSSFREPPGGR